MCKSCEGMLKSSLYQLPQVLNEKGFRIVTFNCILPFISIPLGVPFETFWAFASLLYCLLEATCMLSPISIICPKKELYFNEHSHHHTMRKSIVLTSMLSTLHTDTSRRVFVHVRMCMPWCTILCL